MLHIAVNPDVPAFRTLTIQAKFREKLLTETTVFIRLNDAAGLWDVLDLMTNRRGSVELTVTDKGTVSWKKWERFIRNDKGIDVPYEGWELSLGGMEANLVKNIPGKWTWTVWGGKRPDTIFRGEGPFDSFEAARNAAEIQLLNLLIPKPKEASDGKDS